VKFTGYGHLEKILVCQLCDHAIWKEFRGKKMVLALVTPCKTEGRDASLELVSYTTTLAPIVMDLLSIKAVVGRILTRNAWWIIDRSPELASAMFEVAEDEEDE